MRITVVFGAITRNWLRSRRGLFFSFLFPVLFLLVFGALFSNTGSGAYSLTVQDKDLVGGTPSPLSLFYISELNQTRVISVSTISPTANVTSYIVNNTGFFGSDPRVLVIPAGFQNDVKQNISVDLTYISSPSDQIGSQVAGVIGSVSTSFNYLHSGTQPLLGLTSESSSTVPLKTIDYYVPGLIAAFMMTNGVIGLTNVATEFKRTGLTKRLSATPLTKMEWMLGNVLSQGVLAIILAAAMIILAKGLFQSDVSVGAVTVLALVVGAVAFAGIGMTLAGLVSDPESAVGLGNAIAFPMMFLSGTFFPLDLGPPYLQTISKILPLTYFSNALRDSMTGGSASAALINIGVLGAFAVAFIAIGAKSTTWKQD